MKVTRRAFLKLGVVSGVGLVFNARLRRAAANAPDATFQPSVWIRIDSAGRVAITVARSEMGQGVRTALPLIVAEELDVDPTSVEILQAKPGPAFPRMRTGGSWSVGGSFVDLRRAGAAAREMLISAAATTWNVPRETCAARDGEVVERAGARRLPYGALVDAASRLEPPANPPLRAPGEWRRIGARTKRVDGPSIVDGTARYGIDVRIPGMRFASVVRPPVVGGRVSKVDATRTKAVSGVLDVVTVPSGVAVVATSTWAALRGRDVLDVSFEDGSNASFDSVAFRKSLAAATETRGRVARAEGEADAALRSASKRLDALYEYPFLVHAPLEPMNAVADVRPDACTVWTGTQAANQVQSAVAARLGIAEEKVIVNVTLLGGGFGRRLGVDFAVEAVDVSKAAKAPVQVLWTRADDVKHGYFQPASATRMAGGLDAGGAVVAFTHHMAGSLLNRDGRPNLADPNFVAGVMWGGFDNPYALPGLRVEHVVVDSPVPTGPWRAVHAPPCVFARECFLDELARAGGRDPLEVRRGLLNTAENASDGTTAEMRRRLARVLDLAAEKAGWARAVPAGHGLGIAGHIYDSETTIAMVAEVSVADGGRLRIHRIVCAVDCGLVVNPLGLEGQIESAVVWGLSGCLGCEITFRNGRVEQSSYSDYPVLRFPDAPPVETHIVAGGTQPLGIGEQPVALVAPAILNGVFSATGKRIRRLPLRPADLVG